MCGQCHGNIQLCPIVHALGTARTAALPGFHAWSGADITGNFAFKGKLECWKAFLEADEECVTAFADLSSTILPTVGMFYAIEKLVCQLYLRKTKISSLKDLRWLEENRPNQNNYCLHKLLSKRPLSECITKP